MIINKLVKKISNASIITLAMGLALVPVFSATLASAAPITGRKLTLSSSAPSATGVNYAFSTTAALPTTGTPVKSVQIQFCTTASGTCTTPSGTFSTSSATLASQPTGVGAAAGWTANTVTAGSLRILNASNATNPTGNVTVSWNGVTNPTATNTTFFGRVTTYSDSAWTTAVDSGVVAVSTASQIQVALSVDETLTFCTGISITGQNCGTVTGSLVNLGTGSTTSTSTGTSVMAASTNGPGGYTITVNGNTLQSGSNSIAALGSGGASVIGQSQFGINLAGSNTTPAIGSAITGTGTAAALTNYGTNNNFRFTSGDSVASVVTPTNANTFTISYIANIDGLTPAGSYSTNLTYVATPNF